MFWQGKVLEASFIVTKIDKRLTHGGECMGSEWAKEAERQAAAIARDLTEVGKERGLRVRYQKREARFALKIGSAVTYFSAHAYESLKGMDWQQLRLDIFQQVKQCQQSQQQGATEIAGLAEAEP